MKKHIREITALLFGFICAVYAFNLRTDSDKTTEPIVISLNYFSRIETAGVSIRYTTETQEELSDNKKVCSERLFGSNDLEFRISEENLCKLEMSFDSFPGPFFVKDITITGEETVKINNFENATINDIDDIKWEGTKANMRSDQAHPSILFNTPLNIHAKSNYAKLYAKLLTVFFLSSLIFYLIICLANTLFKKGTYNGNIYTTCVVLFSGVVASYAAARIAEKVGSCYEDSISISAKVQAQKDTQLSIFYTTNEEDGVESAHKQTVKLTEGTNEFTQTLSTKYLNKLRLVFENAPGNISLEQLTLKGESVQHLNDEFSFTNCSEADSLQVSGERLVLKSSAGNPHISFQKEFNLKGKTNKNINAVVFLSLFIAILALLTIVLRSASKSVESAKAEDIALVFFFLLICAAPSWFLTDKTVSETEKRMLAEFPKASNLKGLNSSYSQEFESWYSDHFAGREQIVDAYNKLIQTKGDAQSVSVIEGKDGWYFYKQDNNIENFSNYPVISNEELILIKDYLTTINNWCNAHGKKFYVLVCPNKATIYGTEVKHIKKLQDDTNSDAMRVLNTLKNTDIKVVFSKDELLRHKDDGELLFRKQDTHHSDIGAYYSYKAAMDLIGKDFSLKAKPLNEIPTANIKETKNCDLRQLMPGAMPDDTCTYKHLLTQSPFIVETDRVSTAKITNKKGKHSLYLLADSYSHLLQHFFAMDFAEVEVNRAHQYWFTNEELQKIETNADVVVLEIVERHLSALSRQNICTKMQAFKPNQKEKQEALQN